MINDNFTLGQFQELNRTVYLVVNDRGYSIQDMVSRFHRHITQVLKAVRKEKYDNIM